MQSEMHYEEKQDSVMHEIFEIQSLQREHTLTGMQLIANKLN